MLADLAPSPVCLGGVCLTWNAILEAAGFILFAAAFLLWLPRSAKCSRCNHPRMMHSKSKVRLPDGPLRPHGCITSGCECRGFEHA